MQKTTVFVRTESTCKQCPLRDRRRVWGRGELKNGICLIGEAPGEDEDASGIPFIGRAGNKLNSGLYKSNINRDASWLTNIICCRPPSNNIKSFEAQEAIECCRSGFLQEMEYLKSEGMQIIVALGNTALQHLIPDAPSITRSRGSLYLFNDVPLLPTFHPSYIMRGAHFKKNDTSVDSTLIWYADLRKAKSIAEDGWKEPKENFNIYPNIRDIEDFLDEAKKNKQHLAVDIETSGGIRRDKAEVFVIGLARDEEHAICIPLLELNKRAYWTEEELHRVRELLNDAFQKQKLIFQNALFDVPILNNNGFTVPWSSVEHDTILLFHALYPELPKNLGFIVSLYGQTPYWKEEFSFRTTAISQMDQEQLRIYNCRDCVVLHQVTPKMVEDLKQLGEDTYTAYREEFLALLEPVDQMMATGVGFSKKNLQEYKKLLEEEVKKLEEQLYSLPPLPRKIIQRKKNGEIINQEAAFNLDSHEDLRWFLFRKDLNKFKKLKELEKKRAGTIVYEELQGLKLLRDETPFLFNTRSLTLPGARSGTADLNEEGRLSLRIHLQNELERLENRKRIDQKVINDKAGLKTLIKWLELFDEYKHLAKILSTYFKFSPWSDGRIHAQFLIWGTATGRLSSKSPNMQQLPKRRKGIRRAFIAPKGKILISADYSNLEVRVLAEIANDDVLRQEVNSNVHDSNTRTLFTIDKDHPLWPVARDAAKVFMFGGISYGGGPREIYKKVLIKAPGMQLTFKRFKEALQRWFIAHPGYTQWSQRIKETVAEERVARIFNGRVRQLFGSERDIYKEALNTPIQGGAAVVVNRAAIRLVKRIKEEQLPMKLILQIHDQLIFEADEEHLLPLAKIIKEEMEREVEINNRPVRFPVDVEAGKNLEDLKEIATL